MQEAFSSHINYVLADDPWLTKSGILPIDPTTMALFDAVKDGILVWCVAARVRPTCNVHAANCLTPSLAFCGVSASLSTL